MANAEGDTVLVFGAQKWVPLAPVDLRKSFGVCV